MKPIHTDEEIFASYFKHIYSIFYPNIPIDAYKKGLMVKQISKWKEDADREEKIKQQELDRDRQEATDKLCNKLGLTEQELWLVITNFKKYER